MFRTVLESEGGGTERDHLVLVILAVIWAAVLLPPFLQNRGEQAGRFRILDVPQPASACWSGTPSERAGPHRPTARPAARCVRQPSDRPPDRSGRRRRARLARTAAKKRRRDVLVTLLASAGITLVLTLVLPQVLFFHLAIDVLLAGYVFLLVQRRKLAEERATKVRYMARCKPAATPPCRCAASSRRSAGGLQQRRSGFRASPARHRSAVPTGV